MKTARRAGLEGALVGEVLTIARGGSWITIPAREIADLVAILRELSPGSEAAYTAPRATQPARVASPPAWNAPAPAAPRPKRARRGRVWEGVKNYLRDTGRAQGFAPLLKMVKDNGLTERDPEHALRICLGKKVATGELLKTASGRYAMPRMRDVEDGTEPPIEPLPPRIKKKRKHRPGELWRQMKVYMRDFADGLTLDELVVAADNGRWTSAESTRHAVKICLSRVGDQVERMDGGRFRLTGLTPPPERKPSAVRRRRKRDAPETGEVEAPQTLPIAEAALPDRNDPAFDASAHYPTPRSRQPS